MPPDPPSFPLAPATHLKIHSAGPDHKAYVYPHPPPNHIASTDIAQASIPDPYF